MTSKLLMQLLVGVLGVIAMVTGLQQIYRGINKFAGGTSPFVKAIQESEELYQTASDQGVVCSEKFTEVLNQFDSLGPLEFRKEKVDFAKQLQLDFAKVEDQFSQASKKAIAADDLDPKSKMHPYLIKFAVIMDLNAGRNQWNRQIVGVLLDDNFRESQDVVERITAMAAERDVGTKKIEEEQAALEVLGNSLRNSN